MKALFEREPCNFGTPNMAKNTPAKRNLKPVKVDEAELIADLRDLIQSARQRIATVANAAQTLLYWRLGREPPGSTSSLWEANCRDGVTTIEN